MQGWRVEMEDAHTCETNIPGRPGTSFFCVFDGHGGSLVAKEAAVKLLPKVQATAAYTSGDQKPETLSKALYDGLIEIDAELREIPVLKTGEDHSGSTAVTSFITPTHIVFGNAGDSRAMLARGGSVHFATDDHKPTNPEERGRVEKAGGFIEMGRVCGNLAVSRALGDYQYKDREDLPPEAQKITVAADMTVMERHQDDEFLILCCDGIWDVMTNEQCYEFVVNQLKGGFTAPQICERLMDHCLAKNSKDNMSVLLVLFANAPKKVDGFVVPKIGPDEEDQERIKNAAEQEAAIARRLSSLLAAQAGVEPAQDNP